MTDLTVALRLLLDSRDFTRGLAGSGRGFTEFGRNGRREISRLDDLAKKARNTLATLGVGLAAGKLIQDSALLDKSLVRIGQTTGANRAQVKGLRDEIFKLARETGRPIDTLVGGFNNLIQSGLDFRAALATTRAINPASAVTGAGEDVLAGGLAVAASAFQFDLSQPRIAVDLLDQMVVAGRLGNAELEDLASIFARVGVNAKSANLSFVDTLAFVEGLSQVERNPERLSTLADSTLRLFTNQRYQQAATKATGVRFFGADGASRDPLAVLDDIAGRYRALATDQARSRFIAKAFGEADLDTQKGLRTLLGGDSLAQIRDFTRQIQGASGTVARDLPDAIDNAVDQASRLGTNLREAGEAFARPINRTISDLIEFQLDPKEKGGLGLGPGAAVATTGALIVGTTALASLARSLLGKIPFIGGAASDAAGTAAGLAQGQLVKQAGLATPVFVTNFPSGSSGAGGGVQGAVAGAVAGAAIRGGLLARLGGLLAPLGTSAGIGAAALGTAGVLSAGAGGFELGSAINRNFIDGTQLSDQIGRAVAIALATFGNQDARDALNARNREAVNGQIKIELDDKRARISQVQTRGPIDFNFASGPLALGQ